MAMEESSENCLSVFHHPSSPSSLYTVCFPSEKTADEPFQSDSDSQDEDKVEELRFMEQLKAVYWKRYYYYQEIIKDLNSHELMGDEDTYAEFAAAKRYEYFPFKPLNLGEIKHYSFAELKEMTESFNQNNLILKFSFGRVLKGTAIGQTEYGSGHRNVIVKTWDILFSASVSCCYHPVRLHDEINILRDPVIRSNPHVVKLIGFHCDKMLAIVYEEGWSVRRLTDIIASDDFGWDDRMHVAIAIGDLLKLFHGRGLEHGGIDSYYTLIDENCIPKSFNFRVYSYYEDLPEAYDAYMSTRYGLGVLRHVPGPTWHMEYDVFAYGILLLELIGKRFMSGKPLCFWFEDRKTGCKKSLVHESFLHMYDEKLISKITELAVRCLGFKSDRPVIGDVMDELKMWVDSIRQSKQLETYD